MKLKKTRNIRKYKLNSYEKLIAYLLYWSAFQDFVLPVFYKFSDSSLLTNILFYQKDIIFIVLLAWCLKYRQNKKYIVFFSLYILIIGVGAVHGFMQGSSISSIVSDARGLLILPGFVMIGYGIRDTKFKNFIVEKYIPFLVFCAIFGLLDYFADKTIGTMEFWTNGIGLTKYLTDIKHIDPDSHSIINGLPGNFYGYGPNGEYFYTKRVVSFWANPLGACYVLVLPLIYYFFQITYFRKRDRKTIIYFIICFTAVFLTKTRAVLLAFVVAVMIFAIVKLEERGYIILAGGLALVFLVIRKGLVFFVLYFVDGSTMGHLSHLLDFNYLFNLFGNGLGVPNNQVESVFLTVIQHVGWAGVILFVFMYLIPLIKSYKNRYANDFTIMVAYAAITYIVGGIFSAMLLRYTTVMPLFLMLGYAQNYTALGDEYESIGRRQDSLLLGVK